MIYLYANRSYGAPFLEAAGRYARRTGARITVVFSGHRRRHHRGNGAVAALRSLAARWRRAPKTVAGLPAVVIDDINAPAFVAAIEPGDVGIIAGFDQIFKARAIERFVSFVNFHPSLLPYYRGPEPAYWCIENAETVTGFTIHTVTTKIDSGEIHHQEMLRIDPDEEPSALTGRIALLAIPAFERWLDHVSSGTPWTKTVVDAAGVYRTLVDYKSFRTATAPQRK
jgi:methionyl-tRNA formyltransferase